MISLILIVLAAIANAVMDAIAHHNSLKRWGRWWSQEGWVNKYKPRPDDYPMWLNWYVPENYRFKFPFGWMVVFTDAWHFFKLLMLLFWSGAVIAAYYTEPFINIWVQLGLMYPVWNGTFIIWYKYILVKKK